VLKSSERAVLLRVSRTKECARGVCEEGLPKVKIEPEGEGSRGRVSWKGVRRSSLKGQTRAENRTWRLMSVAGATGVPLAREL